MLVIPDTEENLDLVNGVLMHGNIPFTGLLESYYNSGKIKSRTNYSTGRKEGLEKEWYQNDSVFSERFYNKGIKIGVHKAWWHNGNPKFIYHFNSKGEYHGNIKEWYETGSILKDFNYVNRNEVGSQKVWYETGKIKANYEVINGERFGLIGLKKCYQVSVGSEEVN